MLSVLVSSLEASLANRLKDIFNFAPNEAAIYFSILFAGALTWSIICAFLSPKSDKSLIIMALLFICGLSLLMIGPSSLLKIPPYKAIVAVGLFLAGSYTPIGNYTISQALIYTKPSVPK